jgi:hypothetical protein
MIKAIEEYLSRRSDNSFWEICFEHEAFRSGILIRISLRNIIMLKC